MEIEKQIPLRPRFEIIVPKPVTAITDNAKRLSKSLKPDYILNTLDNHIWIYIGKANKKTYSPHLHLELEELENGDTKMKGLFGPEPGLWTMFIFLHFVVAGMFIIFGVIAYSNWTLGQSFEMPITIMLLMIIAWFSLYFTARSNRKKGMPQARELEKVMKKLWKTYGRVMEVRGIR